MFSNAVGKTLSLGLLGELEVTQLTFSFKVIGLALLIYRDGSQDRQGIG